MGEKMHLKPFILTLLTATSIFASDNLLNDTLTTTSSSQRQQPQEVLKTLTAKKRYEDIRNLLETDQNFTMLTLAPQTLQSWYEKDFAFVIQAALDRDNKEEVTEILRIFDQTVKKKYWIL